MKVHKSQTHNRIEPWQDKTTMEYLYLKKRMSSGEIADILPCNKGHVKRWLRNHGIQRTMQEGAKIHSLKQPPCHRWHNGYEQIVTSVNGQQEGVQIHRLVAVAEWGFDAVKDKVVHHRNGVKWDNRAENLRPMDNGEHTSHHVRKGDLA
jgi:hypothetical protein